MKKTVTTLLACATLFANAQSWQGHNSFADYDNALYGELMEDIELDLTYAELLADPNFWITRPLENDFDPSVMGTLDWYLKKKLDTRAGVADTDGDGLLDIVEYMFATQRDQFNSGDARDEFDSQGYGTTFVRVQDPGRINVTGPETYEPGGLFPDGNGRLRLRANVITGSTDMSFRWEGSADGVNWEDCIIDEVYTDPAGQVGDQISGSKITKTFWWVTPENYQHLRAFRLVATITDPSWNDGNTWEYRTRASTQWGLPWGKTDNFSNWHRHYFRQDWWKQFDSQPGGRDPIKAEVMTGNYDSDGDGVSDFIEYAMGGSPAFPDPHLLGNPIKIVKGENGQVQFEYTFNSAVGDISLGLRGSNNLVDWSPLQGAMSFEPASVPTVLYNPGTYQKFTIVPDSEFKFWRVPYGFDPFFTPVILGWWF